MQAGLARSWALERIAATQRDNFSATGNVNPYTGAVGTRNPRY
jgi:hypothetical protein